MNGWISYVVLWVNEFVQLLNHTQRVTQCQFLNGVKQVWFQNVFWGYVRVFIFTPYFSIFFKRNTIDWWNVRLMLHLTITFYMKNGSGDLGSIPGRVIPKTQKMVLDASLLNTQHYKVQIKGKVEQPGKGVAPSPTPWCSCYRKGSIRVTLDFGRQHYLL